MSKDIRLQLGQRIRELRGRFNLTQDELAGRSGISTKFLQNLEGKTPKTASIITVQKLSAGFDMKLLQFLDFEEELIEEN